jgi:ATP-binding cassette subfamily F protein uup
VLLVSHDRAFLNNVVTSTLAIEADGQVKEYDGGYDDYIRQRTKEGPSEPSPSTTGSRPPSAPGAKVRIKLTFKERRELELLPERIEILESELRALHAAMADPLFYKQDGSMIAQAKARLAELEHELARAYERWEALEGVAD